MAKYKIQVNKTLQARIPGPGLKDIVFRVMMEPDGKGIIADYKKNPVTKAKQKKERVDTVIKKLGKPANTREEKKAVRKEAIEEIKKEEEQNQEARKLYLKSLDEFIHNLGIELDLTRTAAFNKENLTRQLHDKEFAKITGQKLVNMVYNRLDKLYKKSKRQENAKENN